MNNKHLIFQSSQSKSFFTRLQQVFYLDIHLQFKLVTFYLVKICLHVKHTTVHRLLNAVTRLAAVRAHPALVTLGTKRNGHSVITYSMSSTIVQTFCSPAPVSCPVCVTCTCT
jgi:hypothetical protein